MTKLNDPYKEYLKLQLEFYNSISDAISTDSKEKLNKLIESIGNSTTIPDIIDKIKVIGKNNGNGNGNGNENGNGNGNGNGNVNGNGNGNDNENGNGNGNDNDNENGNGNGNGDEIKKQIIKTNSELKKIEKLDTNNNKKKMYELWEKIWDDTEKCIKYENEKNENNINYGELVELIPKLEENEKKFNELLITEQNNLMESELKKKSEELKNSLYKNKPIGLIWSEQSCYFSSIIQSLFNLNDFMSFIQLSNEILGNIINTNIYENEYIFMISIIKEFSKEYINSNTNINIETYLPMILEKLNGIKVNEQTDVTEFFIPFINMLSEEMNFSLACLIPNMTNQDLKKITKDKNKLTKFKLLPEIKKVIGRNIDQELYDEKLINNKLLESSKFNDMFHLDKRKQIICKCSPNNDKIIYNYDLNLYICHVTIKDEHDNNISMLLKNMETPEIIGEDNFDRKCSTKCNTEQNISSSNIWVLYNLKKNNNLIIHIVRERIDDQKITNEINIELNIEINDNETTHNYKLNSVIYHIGTGGRGGHYISVVNRNDEWWVCNDQNIDKYDTNNITDNYLPDGIGGGNCYLIFYEKVK